jgi:alkylhydroperoxidase family enzyme
VLRSEFFTAEEVEAIVRDYRSAGLSGEDVALISFAEKVALDAHKVTQEDIDRLRRRGFSDEEILDVALTAAARSFFSKVLDAVGAEPDAKYQDLEQPLRETLTVGRKFPQTEE